MPRNLVFQSERSILLHAERASNRGVNSCQLARIKNPREEGFKWIRGKPELMAPRKGPLSGLSRLFPGPSVLSLGWLNDQAQSNGLCGDLDLLGLAINDGVHVLQVRLELALGAGSDLRTDTTKVLRSAAKAVLVTGTSALTCEMADPRHGQAPKKRGSNERGSIPALAVRGKWKKKRGLLDEVLQREAGNQVVPGLLRRFPSGSSEKGVR